MDKILLRAAMTVAVTTTCLAQHPANLTPHQWIADYNKPGDNYSGHLHWVVNSDGSVSRFLPGGALEPVPGLAHVIALDSTNFHMLALKDDGTVWGWGDASDGQLGDPHFNKPHSEEPIQASISGVVAISTFGNSSIALKRDGTVWVWGGARNDFPHTPYKRPPGPYHPFLEAADPLQVPSISDVKAISGRLMLKSDGTVWTWKPRPPRTDRPEGALIQIEGIRDAVMVSDREFGGSALLRNGTIMTWGKNTKGELGNGETRSSELEKMVDTPVMVKNVADAVDLDCRRTCFAVLRDGSVKAWGWGAIGGMGSGRPGGSDINSTPKLVPIPKNAVSVKGGPSSGFALMQDGTIWGWGADVSTAGKPYHQSWTPLKVGTRQ